MYQSPKTQRMMFTFSWTQRSCFHVCVLSKTTLAVILHLEITLSLLVILFSWGICSQIRRCHWDATQYRQLPSFSSHLLTFNWEDILIFISAWLIHEEMCTGVSYLPPGPVSGRRQWGCIDSSPVSFLQHRNSSIFMLVYNLSYWLCRWLLCGEKCEPSPWTSWYVGLKWTHADISYYWPADVVIFFVFLLSDGRRLRCSLCRRGLGGIYSSWGWCRFVWISRCLSSRSPFYFGF